MKYLIFSFILGCVCLTSSAAIGDEFTQNGLTYIVKTENTVGVSSVSSDVTECIVPETVTNNDIAYTVIAIEKDAFYWSNVKNITLPNTITSIGYGAFRSSPLASISLPSNLTTIGEYAFYKTELVSITIPEGVTAIEASTFSQCTYLTEINLPSTLQKIGQGAFYKSSLTAINIPTSCTTLGMYAFEHCSALAQITLPNGLVEIPMGLFQDCTSLAQITIPESVTTIKEAAFQNTGLTTIHFPKNVNAIQANSFNDTQLSTISVDENNTTFTLIDGALYTTDKRFIYLYPRITETKKYDIIDGCVAVWGGAFYGCDIKTVTFPDNFIGIDAFSFCYSQLESIELPNSIEAIWEQAFAGTKLTSITIPEGVTQLTDAILADCQELSIVTLPSKLTAVGNRAFFRCTALTTINCLGTTPSEFDAWETYTDPFYGVDCSKITIKCPTSSVEDYKLSEWGDFFTNIEGTDFNGVEDNFIKDIAITTNNGIIAINLFNGANCNVSISDLNGVVLYNIANVQNNFHTKNLPHGIYIVSIQNAKSTIVKKVIL